MNGKDTISRDDSGKFESKRHAISVTFIRMPRIMDVIRPIPRQDRFEIQNTKDKEKTFGFHRETVGVT